MIKRLIVSLSLIICAFAMFAFTAPAAYAAENCDEYSSMIEKSWPYFLKAWNTPDYKSWLYVYGKAERYYEASEAFASPNFVYPIPQNPCSVSITMKAMILIWTFDPNMVGDTPVKRYENGKFVLDFWKKLGLDHREPELYQMGTENVELLKYRKHSFGLHSSP